MLAPNMGFVGMRMASVKVPAVEAEGLVSTPTLVVGSSVMAATYSLVPAISRTRVP